jgi:tetratricopeptide (TPR) repeat protein
MRGGLRLLPLLALTACATPPPHLPAASPAPPPETPAPSPAAERLQSALVLLQAKNFKDADTAFRQLLTAADFPTLAPADQHRALMSAGSTALRLRDAPRALALMQRAMADGSADYHDWIMRASAANYAGAREDASAALLALLTRWPQEAQRADPRSVAEIVERTPYASPQRLQLIEQLRYVDFDPEPLQASRWWRELALRKLQRGDVADAAALIARVTDPYVLIGIRADARYAVLWRSTPPPDVEALARRRIELAREDSASHPHQLEPIVTLARRLIYSLRFEEAVALTDQALQRDAADPQSAFGDRDRQLPSILYVRSHALYHQGRFDDAVADLRRAAQLPGPDGSRVGEVINLADRLNDLGRAQEALEALKTLGSAPDTLSPFGLMQLNRQRAVAAAQLNDVATMDSALAYMRAHRTDAASEFQQTLAMLGREDEAAQVLIERLADPQQQSDALTSVQKYGHGVRGPADTEMQRRYDAMLRRADVQAAIRKVAGTVRAYALEEDITAG